MPIQFISLGEIIVKTLAGGGKEVEIFGTTGSGKTTLLLGIAMHLIDDEICIFRGLPSGQEFRFPGPLNIIAYQCHPKFLNIPNPPEPTIVNGSFKDVLDACVIGKLNVLYFPFENERHYWVSFARFLNRRHVMDFKSIYISLLIDEAHEVMPTPEEGKTADSKAFIRSMADFRKFFVSGYFATHQHHDIHYLVHGKIQYRIYLKGAIVPKRETRVEQGLIDSLKLGQGILSGSFFGMFTFDNYPPKYPVLVEQQ